MPPFFLIYLSLMALVFHESTSHPFPTVQTEILNVTMGYNDASEGDQMAITAERIIVLTALNEIRSYYRNGTMAESFTRYRISGQNVIYFQITPDESEIVFYARQTKKVFIMPTTDFQSIQMLELNDLPGQGYITGVIKISDQFLLVICPKSWKNEQPVSQWIYKYSLYSESFLDNPGVIKMGSNFLWVKHSPTLNALLIYNVKGQTAVYYINSGYAEPLDNFYMIPKISMGHNCATFSDDGTHLAVMDPQGSTMHLFRLEWIQGHHVYRRFYNGSISKGAVAMRFWDVNYYLAVFYRTNITFYTLTADSVINPVNIDYGVYFLGALAIYKYERILVSSRTWTSWSFSVRSLRCPTGQMFTDEAPPPSNQGRGSLVSYNPSLLCTSDDPPYVYVVPDNSAVTNITIPKNSTNTTINTNKNSTTNTATNTTKKVTPPKYTAQDRIRDQKTLFDFQNLAFFFFDDPFPNFLNQFPGSRVLLRPIFTFFRHIDDLQLYNYLNVTFSPTIRYGLAYFDIIEQRKLDILSMDTLWDGEIDFKSWGNSFNTSLRWEFTSRTFQKLAGRANGYILNTFQFYFSYFILLIGIFILGHFVHRLLMFFGYFNIAFFFKKFKIWMTIPLLLYDGNVQYQFYQIGFQIKNLWVSDFSAKTNSVFITFFTFVLFFGLSTIFFVLRKMYGNRSKYCFENERSTLKGVLYMIFILGIRNILLGFLHQFLPDNQDFILTKLLIFMGIEIACILGTVFLLMKGFIKSRLRQWIFVWAAFIKIVIILGLYLDLSVTVRDNRMNGRLGFLYGYLIVVFTICWPALLCCEGMYFIFRLRQMYKAYKKLKAKKLIKKHSKIQDAQKLPIFYDLTQIPAINKKAFAVKRSQSLRQSKTKRPSLFDDKGNPILKLFKSNQPALGTQPNDHTTELGTNRSTDPINTEFEGDSKEQKMSRFKPKVKGRMSLDPSLLQKETGNDIRESMEGGENQKVAPQQEVKRPASRDRPVSRDRSGSRDAKNEGVAEILN